MAKKRALVDLALTLSGASEKFTQDVEDMPETVFAQDGASAPPPPQPEKQKDAPDRELPQTQPAEPHWTRLAKEREVFTTWREQNALTDAECKRLLAAYSNLPEVKFFRDVPGTRLEIQNMIEAQIAREAAMGKPEEAKSEPIPF